VKFVPLIVTLIPTARWWRKARDRRRLTTVNELLLVAVPPGVVTLSARRGPRRHVAWIAVAELT